MSTVKNRSRLGKGLSALLNAPVQVAAPEGPPSLETAPSGPMPSSIDVSLPDGTPDGTLVIRSLATTAIIPNKYQPRQSFDQAGLDRLAESIRSTGMMQPIVVRPRAGAAPGDIAAWEIIAGERRWRAAQIARLESVPVIVSEIDDQAAAEWALIENLQREDLNPIDRARAFKGLADQFGLSHAQIADRVGLERSTIANTVRLIELEPEIQAFLRDGLLSAGHAKALLSLPAGSARVELATQAHSGGWSVRHMEDRVRRMLEVAQNPSHLTGATPVRANSAGRDELERQLGEHLGTKVQIKTNATGDKGSLVISFFDVQHFDGLMERLGFELRS